MPSSSARAPNQRSSASAAGRGVDGELGSRWQAVASGGGFAHNLTSLVGRGAGGGRTVARVGSPCRSRRGLVGRMGRKCPETGSKRRFLEEYATWPITAQLLFRQVIRSRVASDESLERNGRKSHFYIKLRRNPSSPNFCRKPENVALRSILTPAGWGVLYPARRAASTVDPDDSRAKWDAHVSRVPKKWVAFSGLLLGGKAAGEPAHSRWITGARR